MTPTDIHADIDAACRLIAHHAYGPYGDWAYEAFDYINGAFFEGSLPPPHIVWAITAHGGCLGLTHSRTDRIPVITLHPSLLGGLERADPWGVDPALLGVAYACDVLLHECIHVSVAYLHGWAKGPSETSHNNPIWIAEVNRLAAAMGLDVTAGRSTLKRIPIEGAPPGPRGKPPTKVQRVTAGTIPYKAVATFPYSVRLLLGQTDYYRQPLPFSHSLATDRNT